MPAILLEGLVEAGEATAAATAEGAASGEISKAVQSEPTKIPKISKSQPRDSNGRYTTNKSEPTTKKDVQQAARRSFGIAGQSIYRPDRPANDQVTSSPNVNPSQQIHPTTGSIDLKPIADLLNKAITILSRVDSSIERQLTLTSDQNRMLEIQTQMDRERYLEQRTNNSKEEKEDRKKKPETTTGAHPLDKIGASIAALGLLLAGLHRFKQTEIGKHLTDKALTEDAKEAVKVTKKAADKVAEVIKKNPVGKHLTDKALTEDAKVVKEATVKQAKVIKEATVTVVKKGVAAIEKVVTPILREVSFRRAAFQSGMSSAEVIALMGESKHETSNFKHMTELGSKGMPAGQQYEGRASLKNTQKGDGQKYKGRGFIQITGRGNYKEIGDIIHQDLVNHPELIANDLKINAQASLAYWNKYVKPHIKDFKSEQGIRDVGSLINTGHKGSSRVNGARERLTATASYTAWSDPKLRDFSQLDQKPVPVAIMDKQQGGGWKKREDHPKMTAASEQKSVMLDRQPNGTFQVRGSTEAGSVSIPRPATPVAKASTSPLSVPSPGSPINPSSYRVYFNVGQK